MQSRRLYLRLLDEFRPYGAIAVVTLLAVAVASVTDVLLIHQLQNVVDALRSAGGGDASVPGLPRGGLLGMVQGWIAALLPSTPAQLTLWAIPAIIVGLAFVRMVSSFAGDYGAAWLSSQVQANLREKMFFRILRLPGSFYDQSSNAATLSRVVYDAS
ncbi:MAG TPA: lipid ABC transporter permease/ATP-binding protein, partial [Janthinobacterium sp.]|nr:lipid ABC transporter permease/ATP-binding protein [Janthinobacterium sp.]